MKYFIFYYLFLHHFPLPFVSTSFALQYYRRRIHFSLVSLSFSFRFSFVRKYWMGEMPQINAWTFLVACQQIVDLFTKTNELWQSTTFTDVNAEMHLNFFLVCLTICSLSSINKVASELLFCSSLKKHHCLVEWLRSRGNYFCWFSVGCHISHQIIIRLVWDSPPPLSVKAQLN